MTFALNQEQSRLFPRTPPKAPKPVLSPVQSRPLDLSSPDLYLDGQGLPSDYMYLGHLFKLKTLISLESHPFMEKYKGIGRLFKVTSRDADIAYLIEFNDGQSKILSSFDAQGGLLSYTAQSHKQARVSGDHLMLKDGNDFVLFKIGKTLRKIKRFSTRGVADALQDRSLRSVPSSSFSCSDFQFEVGPSGITIWTFNVGTTGFLADFLHLRLFAPAPKNRLEIKNFFGKATLADRLPVPNRFYSSLKVGQRLYVPRNNDPRVDIFDLEGNFSASCDLFPVPEEIGPEYPLTSEKVLADLERAPNPETFFKRYNYNPMITSIHSIGQDLVITRINHADPKYNRIYTIAQMEGNVIADPLVGQDFYFCGSQGREALFLIKFSHREEALPRWLWNGIQVDPAQLTAHPGYWLVGVEL